MKIVTPSPEGLQQAAAAIAAGEVVAYPTETVYGLAVNPFSQAAVERLFNAKGRNAAAAILVIVANDAQLAQVVAGISPRAQACIDAFWPGPLSLLFKKSAALAPALTGSAAKVGVRCPGLAVARDFCLASNLPLTSTSANRSGEPPALRVEDIPHEGIALAIDGGALAPSAPSTVYDPDTDELFREGAISRAALEAALKSLPA